MPRLAFATLLTILSCHAAGAADGPQSLSCIQSRDAASLALCMARALGLAAPAEATPPPAMCRNRKVPDQELLEPVPLV